MVSCESAPAFMLRLFNDDRLNASKRLCCSAVRRSHHLPARSGNCNRWIGIDLQHAVSRTGQFSAVLAGKRVCSRMPSCLLVEDTVILGCRLFFILCDTRCRSALRLAMGGWGDLRVRVALACEQAELSPSPSSDASAAGSAAGSLNLTWRFGRWLIGRVVGLLVVCEQTFKYAQLTCS